MLTSVAAQCTSPRIREPSYKISQIKEAELNPVDCVSILEMADGSWRLDGSTFADIIALGAELTRKHRGQGWLRYSKSKVAKEELIPTELVDSARANNQRIAIVWPSGRLPYPSRTFELLP